MNKQDKKPSELAVFEVLSWIAASCVVIGGLVVAAYSTFQTRSEAAGSEASIGARQDRLGAHVRDGFGRVDAKLDKLNDKIDALLGHPKQRHR